MLLRVRGSGASPENSQAVLMYLRGFRLASTQPPAGHCNVAGSLRPMIFPHFHVGVQMPDTAPDGELGKSMVNAAWREIWNLYDIAYDELCLFPSVSTITAHLSGDHGDRQQEEALTLLGDAGFTRPTARSGPQTVAVVTHYFPTGTKFKRDKDAGAQVVVLDISAVPAAEAASRIAVELAWVAAYASLQGALGSARHILVRMPYDCLVPRPPYDSPLVQEGIDFLGEHLTLLSRSFTQQFADSTLVEVGFVGPTAEQLQETLKRICEPCDEVIKAGVETEHTSIVVFAGDHHRPEADRCEQHCQAIASSLKKNLRLEKVPVKSLIEGDNSSWDEATRRENQILNFCPCCGHCGGH
ncbi:hypothetical protein ERJ75_000752000 [Trypanosoma vivax]|uniref:Uncharacterized protein n=1 Tax=Trypanosoma vivax (strain Y486) TaxID=1055687 RepID=G0U053_TRYVY|nr:hypothetical protein ERJ75_000752000 [Trypanosoma vivax]CCC49450.1 conserved hypothetical protein [Trypanosoma vivax Y486]